MMNDIDQLCDYLSECDLSVEINQDGEQWICTIAYLGDDEYYYRTPVYRENSKLMAIHDALNDITDGGSHGFTEQLDLLRLWAGDIG